MFRRIASIYCFVVGSAFVLACGWANAQSVTTTSGGSIRTSLGSGIVLNKDSSLSRIWITVHDPAMHVDFKGDVGIKTVYASRGSYTGGYEYNAVFSLIAKEAISAVETRFLVFDIWGQHRRSLVTTEIVDMAAGATKEFNSKWNVFSENEASEHYASVAYVSKVRTRDGRIIASNTNFVLEQARKFSAQFKEIDLEPMKEPKK